MSAYVIWVDSKEAKIFKLSPKGAEAHHLHTHGKKHPVEPYGRQHPHHHPEQEPLFKDVIAAVADAKEILIIGPGEAKSQLKAHFEKHHPKDLAQKIVGVETVDHPTENQILAHARKFFKSYDVLH